ncbi:MAG: 6-phosphogluconate dehydrogenase (decarboxylating) [Candidatus Doudnabacteria bacterium RIFCSPHIGHO2_01_FULL_46_14]|uniref:6-phosphogluconate dehydrogenase (Decarboxylating) n=1 Tax=Candidatus Doudnabacteria bacterium RIFCSPHIGHO2_01_FULL_46_14 TaxID=1817824 RepID=A0A1F5NKP2_9BACT|nr:MAG: 6-phosphogluconate dehydrogenase (decarboxylating) [Candidatus Doudnabacteria bacterium RIFCSPHIGHO2_01_FULL_46_14]
MAHQVTIGIMGLGRMGAQIARRLHTNKFNIIAWNRSPGPREEFAKFGGQVAETPEQLITEIDSPRIVWLMLPAGDLVDEFLFGPKALSLSKGDIVIDGGNSFYRDSQIRAKKLAEQGIHFFDSGTSGGVWGERNGFSIMVGGPKEIWPRVEPVFKALAAGNGENFGLVGPNGAGHFVKMVHNAIEYGMMEAIAEGFGVLKASEFKNLDFSQVAHIWSKGSVVSSWLVDLAKNIFDTEDLDNVVGYVHHTGEGKWTVDEAKRLGVNVPVMEDAFRVRQESEKPENQEIFSNKIVALLRKQFGGHEVKYKK